MGQGHSIGGNGLSQQAKHNPLIKAGRVRGLSFKIKVTVET
jgi:hypothetical protein